MSDLTTKLRAFAAAAAQAHATTGVGYHRGSADKRKAVEWQAADRIEALEAENARLREALMDAGAHLIGAASAYKQYARRYKQRGPADPFFRKRLQDFEKAGDRAIAALGENDEPG